MVAVAALAGCVAFWVMLSGGRQELPKRSASRRLSGILFMIAVVLAIVLATRNIDRDDDSQARSVQGQAATVERDRSRRARSPEFRWPPVLVLGSLALGTAALVLVRARLRGRSAPTTDDELLRELAVLLDETLDDLRAEPDPRRAVIAAYARMEAALAAYGLPRRAFEAPLEYLDRLATEMQDSLPSARHLVFELTHLFERAKFSPHEIDREMKDEAIQSLSSLRDELMRVAA